MSRWLAACCTSSVVRLGWASPCWLSGSCRPMGSRGCRPMWYAPCCAVSCPSSMPRPGPGRRRAARRSHVPPYRTSGRGVHRGSRAIPHRGLELSPWYPGRLEAALEGTTVRACFLGHSTFTADDLASYRGPKPQHEGQASRAELAEAAAWIRHRSHQLREQCREEGLPYVDVGAFGFEAAMQHARRHLIRPD